MLCSPAPRKQSACHLADCLIPRTYRAVQGRPQCSVPSKIADSDRNLLRNRTQRYLENTQSPNRWKSRFTYSTQTGGSLMLFARDHTDRWITVPLSGNWKQLEIPVGWLASIHAGLVIALSPVITLLLGWRQRLGRSISWPVQMAVGTALLAAAYGSLLLPLGSGGEGRVGFGWLFLCYTALSLAEIFVGPLGYSLVSICAPAGYSGLLMGTWLAVTLIGSFLAGEVGARLWTRWSPMQLFAFLAVGCVVICALLVGTQSHRRLGSIQPRSLAASPTPPAIGRIRGHRQRQAA